MVSTCLDHKERGLIPAVGHASPKAIDCRGQHQRNVILRTEQQKRWSEPTNNWTPGLRSAFTFPRADSVNNLAPVPLTQQTGYNKKKYLTTSVPHSNYYCSVFPRHFLCSKFKVSSGWFIQYPLRTPFPVTVPHSLIMCSYLVPCDLNSPLMKNT